MTAPASDASAAGRALAPGLYGFEELEVGDHFGTSRIMVTESHVVGFAGLSGDLFDIHMDDAFAQAHGFPGRLAHGLLGLAMADGLKNRAPVRIAGIASLGWNWRFRRPILIGDSIRARITVTARKPHRNPERGVLTLGFVVSNQDDIVVQEGETFLLCARQPSSGNAPAAGHDVRGG